MKKSLCYFLILALTVATLAALAVIPAAADDTAPTNTKGTYGLTFDASNPLTVSGEITEQPNTISATIYVPKSTADKDRPGIVISNYVGNGYSYSLEIHQYGRPRLFLQMGTTGVNIIFNSLDVRSDKPLRVSVVVGDRTASVASATCYIYDLDGNLVGKQTQTCANKKPYPADSVYSTSKLYMIGGDYRANNSIYFKGEILETAMYSGYRTEAQCATVIDTADKSMICGFDLTKDLPEYGKDLSDNKHHLDGIYTEKEMTGMTFDAAVRQISKPLATLPKTIETWVNVPDVDRPGIFFGQYKDTNCFNFEIGAKGAIKLYFKNAAGTVQNLIFQDANGNNLSIKNTGWVHFAVVINDDHILLYQNGEVISNMPYTGGFSTDPLKYNFVLGGDLRANNAQYFKGQMQSLVAYTDARTAAEIKADMTAVDPNADNLLLYYDLTEVKTTDTTITDLGPNGYHITPPPVVWLDSNPNTPTDYAYSMAIVGDTQQLTRYDVKNGTDYTSAIYDWLVANAGAKNIKLVMGLGDITSDDTDEEWALAMEQIAKLDGVIPYTLNRGNLPHDSTAKFNHYIGANSKYTAGLDGTMAAGSYENAYMTLTVGTTDYLIMMIDWAPTDAALTWAGRVIEKHPDHKVIITTHGYLYKDGEPYDHTDSAIAHGQGFSVKNNGDEIWNELVKLYPNIVMVLSGHDPSDDIITSQVEGIHGNRITQMLIDPQGMDPNNDYATGMVAMFYFSADGSKISVEYISTVRALQGKPAYFKENNQFSLDLFGEGATVPPAASPVDPFNTPYGEIPAEYDVETYPFAVFIPDPTSPTGYKLSKVAKSLLTDSTVSVTATGAAFNFLRPDQNSEAADGAVILMRRDFTYLHTGDPYSNLTYGVAEFTLDLGGYTFTDKNTAGSIFYWYLKATKNFLFTVKNGEIQVGHHPLNNNEGVTPAKLTAPTTITTVYENVRFGFIEGATATSIFGALHNSHQPYGVQHTFSIALFNCTVDYTNAPAGVDLLADGSSPRANIFTRNTEFVNRGNVTPKMNISMASDFILNIYIPVSMADAADKVAGIRIGGIVFSVSDAPVVDVEGTQCYKLSLALTPDALGALHALSVDVDHLYTFSDSTTATKSINSSFTVDIIAYLEGMAKDSDVNIANLGNDILAYIKSVYVYAGGDSAVVDRITAIIGAGYETDNAPLLPEAKKETAGMASASLHLGETPAFIFYPEVDGEGNPVYALENYQFALDGKYRLHAEVKTDENGKQYFSVSTYAYAMGGTVEYLVKGTDIHGYYNISAYLEYANTTGNANLVAMVERLYKYAESAKAYRESR